MKSKINIAIVDDEILIVQLLAEYFSRQMDINVCLTAYGGNEFLKKLNEVDIIPDVVLLDLRMKDEEGVQIGGQLKEKYPDIKVIIISSYYQKSFIGYMVRNGIDAFLPKGLNPDDLKEIIKTVMTKGHYFTKEHVEVMRHQIAGNAPKPKFDSNVLSDREKEVLLAICRQSTAQEIADQLFITRRTVEGHKNSLMAKTGARNSAGLVIYAIQYEIFNPNELMFFC